MKKQNIYRHGEVHFCQIDKLSNGLEETKTNIIAKGSDNHAHSFKGGKLYLKNVDIYIIGYFEAKNTKLYHIEHGDKKSGNLREAKLPNGIYELRTQNEHTPQGLKKVID